MKIEVYNFLFETSKEYPYNYRVEFQCDLADAEQVVDWATDNVKGLCWLVHPGAVIYTTKEYATLSKLKWS